MTAIDIYRQMLRAAGVSQGMLDAIEGEPHETQYILLLTPYEAANLMQMVDAAYRFPHDKERVPEDTPIKRFNSGDWIGSLHWKLQAEVGDEYPVTPNPIYITPSEVPDA